MPKTPKVFRKKSKVKTWFNGLAREVLTGEDLSVRESSVATGNTVDTFQEYPSLPRDDSETEVEMEGPSHPAIDSMAEIIQLLQSQLLETKKELANCRRLRRNWRISSRKIRINHSPRRGKRQQHWRHRILSEE